MTITYPPGPRQVLPWQNFVAFQRDATGFLSNLAQTYGDIVHFKLGFRDFYLFNHPDDVKDVLVTRNDYFIKGQVTRQSKRIVGEGLVTSEGEFHLKQRRLIQPIFHRKRISEYGTVMAQTADLFNQRCQEGQVIEIMEEMARLTLAIVGKTLFDAEVSSETEKVGEAVGLIQEDFWQLLLPMLDYLEKLPIPLFNRSHQARKLLDSVIYRLIAEHRASGDRGDLLSMLLAAQDTEGDGLGMSDDQVRDEAVTLFIAGHETVFHTLAWTWYLLAKNPSVMAELQRELDSVLAGRLPTMDDLSQLSYTRMVFTEAMRLYPAAWVLGRTVVKDYEIQGYVCPPNATVIVSPWVMHHDARYYTNPDQFDPTRWLPEATATRPKFSYFPFGAGQRVCIGEQFVWAEAMLIIATLAQKWRMEVVPNQNIAVKPRITLRSKEGIKIKLQRR